MRDATGRTHLLKGDIRGGSHWEEPRMSPQKKGQTLILTLFLNVFFMGPQGPQGLINYPQGPRGLKKMGHDFF